MNDFELWSIKRIAAFLDMSENYTRNIIVKQKLFPEPRFTNIIAGGKIQKSKPRWFSDEVISWANQAYVTNTEYTLAQPARSGRKRVE